MQDEIFALLPTVLVCPLRAGLALTAVRVEVRIGSQTLVACSELTRPIRRRALRPLGFVDEATSREIMARFLSLLPR